MRAFLAKHKADIIVTASLLFIGLSALIFTLTLSPNGEYVKITKDNTEIARLKLDEDAVYPIDGANTVVIEGGRAYMREALCPDHLCVKTGKIHSVGERIICLPNKVVVEVIKDGEAP